MANSILKALKNRLKRVSTKERCAQVAEMLPDRLPVSDVQFRLGCQAAAKAIRASA